MRVRVVGVDDEGEEEVRGKRAIGTVRVWLRRESENETVRAWVEGRMETLKLRLVKGVMGRRPLKV